MRDARASKSRQEVPAELQAARKTARSMRVSENYDFVRRSPSVKTREQVRAELAQARASGEYAAVNSEAYAFRNGAARTTTFAKGGSRPIPLKNSVREVSQRCQNRRLRSIQDRRSRPEGLSDPSNGSRHRSLEFFIRIDRHSELA